jgi:hypothetical protein
LQLLLAIEILDLVKRTKQLLEVQESSSIITGFRAKSHQVPLRIQESEMV